MKNVVCFGEILWDNFPSGPMPGGAPLNVVYHLQKLGLSSTLVTRLGKDKKGNNLLNFLEQHYLKTDFIQSDPSHKTGEVNIAMNDKGEPSYDIAYPVAWDFIQINESLIQQVKDSSAFIYGTLAARNEESRNTLLLLLEKAPFKIMDVNLRYPHFSMDLTIDLIKRADMLKVNLDELLIIKEWLQLEDEKEEKLVGKLIQYFNLREIVITKGSQGSTYYNMKETFTIHSPKVQVVDTVGSGDAFLAGFIFKKLMSKTNSEALKFGTALAAMVSSYPGACPEYNTEEIYDDF